MNCKEKYIRLQLPICMCSWKIINDMSAESLFVREIMCSHPSPAVNFITASQELTLMSHKIQCVNCDHFKGVIVNSKLLVNITEKTNFNKTVAFCC